jgi:hypothetical protein
MGRSAEVFGSNVVEHLDLIDQQFVTLLMCLLLLSIPPTSLHSGKNRVVDLEVILGDEYGMMPRVVKTTSEKNNDTTLYSSIQQ